LTAVLSRSQVRVRYAETDQMGIAYHGAYFVWFEVARVDYLREHGFTYRELEEKEDLHLPVIEAQARFLKPTFYDDVLEIRTRLTEISGARVSFEYAVHREVDAPAVATGRTAHAAVDKRGRPRRFPEALRQQLS
jgi:acyl-CoA thioester hydrolase